MASDPNRHIERPGEGGNGSSSRYYSDEDESAVFDCAYQGLEPRKDMTFGSNDSNFQSDLFLFNPQAESAKPKPQLPKFLDFSNPFEAHAASTALHR